jgi:VanZ family protein
MTVPFRGAWLRTAILKIRLWLSLWWGVVGYCALIFFLSAQPHVQLPGVFPYLDKFAHCCLYAGLGWLWTRAVKKSRPSWSPRRILLITFGFAVGYGLSDEWHQSYVPGRFADLYDVVADAIGGVCGGRCYLLWTAWAGDQRQEIPSDTARILSSD